MKDFEQIEIEEGNLQPLMGRHPPGLYSIAGFLGHVHLLVDGDSCVLIDTGMLGEVRLVFRQLKKLGLSMDSVEAILLTHGHLDHAGNLHRFKELTSATVYGHLEEQAHLDGAYPYEGVNRVCGWLESVGRFLIRYKRADIDIYIEEEQSLPFWGGLRVVHLPGHTKGHCGYYSAKHDLLFAGDLFASMFYGDFPPPPVLNSVPHLIPESFRKVMALNPGGILPCHYTQAKYDPATLRRIFDEIYWRRFRE